MRMGGGRGTGRRDGSRDGGGVTGRRARDGSRDGGGGDKEEGEGRGEGREGEGRGRHAALLSSAFRAIFYLQRHLGACHRQDTNRGKPGRLEEKNLVPLEVFIWVFLGTTKSPRVSLKG